MSAHTQRRWSARTTEAFNFERVRFPYFVNRFALEKAGNTPDYSPQIQVVVGRDCLPRPGAWASVTIFDLPPGPARRFWIDILRPAVRAREQLFLVLANIPL